MNIPKWLELVLFVVAWLVALVRLRYGMKSYAARRSIFGQQKRLFGVGLLENAGYAAVAFLLGLYFLLSYLDSTVATPVFVLTAILLLAVIAVELAYKRDS